MAEGGAGDCYRCCCSFILTSGLAALFLWLSLRTYNPTCSIQRFYVPPLNVSVNSSSRSNRTIDFDLKLDNGMNDKGVGYANITLAFFFVRNGSRLSVANYTVPAFYQGHGKKAHRRKLVDVGGAMPWDDAIRAVANGTVHFRVDLATRVKYKILFWYTKRHALKVGGDVEVNGTGEYEKKSKKKGIKLKSGYPDQGRIGIRVGSAVVFTFFVILLV